MVNTVMLVGRLASEPEIKTTETGKEIVRISVAVNRSFKNPDGTYDTDFIDCTLWDGLAKNLSEYCKKGDTIGIRGRLQVSTYEKDGTKIKRVDVIAERVTFLGSTTKEPKVEVTTEVAEKKARYKKDSK